MKTKVSVNIVHTIDYKRNLSDNVVLSNQLNFINESGIAKVNVLLNGVYKEDSFKFAKTITNNIIISDKLLNLGYARNILWNETNTPYFINIDEDDEFYIDNFVRLVKLINKENLDFNLLMISFTNINDWDRREFYMPREFKNGEPSYKIVPSVCSYCSWNFIYNKEFLLNNNLEWPNSNKYEDCLFYVNLYGKINNCDLINLPIIKHYNQLDSMSTTDNFSDALKYPIDYLLKHKYFKINKLIKL